MHSTTTKATRSGPTPSGNDAEKDVTMAKMTRGPLSRASIKYLVSAAENPQAAGKDVGFFFNRAECIPTTINVLAGRGSSGVCFPPI
jgi:hypothetical protein